MKLHLIAVASICVVTTVIYTLSTPAPQTSGDAIEDGRSIEIYSATWGENCNPTIADLITKRESTPLTKDDHGVIVAPPSLVPVQPNNVLIPVSKGCNGKARCEFPASSETLGVEPLESCFKHLVVQYRCFSYDRSWSVDAGQGTTFTIDCHAKTSATSPKH